MFGEANYYWKGSRKVGGSVLERVDVSMRVCLCLGILSRCVFVGFFFHLLVYICVFAYFVFRYIPYLVEGLCVFMQA